MSTLKFTKTVMTQQAWKAGYNRKKSNSTAKYREQRCKWYTESPGKRAQRVLPHSFLEKINPRTLKPTRECVQYLESCCARRTQEEVDERSSVLLHLVKCSLYCTLTLTGLKTETNFEKSEKALHYLHRLSVLLTSFLATTVTRRE